MLVIDKITIKQKAAILIVFAILYNIVFIMTVNNHNESMLVLGSSALIFFMLWFSISVVKETKDNKNLKISLVMGVVAIFMAFYMLVVLLINKQGGNNIALPKYGELASLYLLAFCVIVIKQYNENVKLIAVGANSKNRCPNCETENADNYEDCIKCGVKRTR